VLPNDAAAQRRAVELATDLANKANAGTKAVRVTNGDGDILFRVPIRRSTSAS
jgi:hypothetical protein